MAGDKSSEVGYVKGTASHPGGSFIAGENFSSSKDRVSLGINVDIDCSDTIKGLKTIQREAKKATAALKELSDEAVVRKGIQKSKGLRSERDD